MGLKRDVYNFLKSRPRGATVIEIGQAVYPGNSAPAEFEAVIRSTIRTLRPEIALDGEVIDRDFPKTGATGKYVLRKAGRSPPCTGARPRTTVD